jgi:hypothetical protein
VPPARAHKPFPGDHIHQYVVNQSPYPTCKCFWHPNGVYDGAGRLPSGDPIRPVGGGGPM